ncbi:S-layer protein [Paraburkholderia sp.]|uniref:S-layer protein n=1 Tax=Paraburkholderia sp. TaxID=1926495 RepID=UPI0025FCD641|nr:S-layer protein [Paraburkholderia sp.]
MTNPLKLTMTAMAAFIIAVSYGCSDANNNKPVESKPSAPPTPAPEITGKWKTGDFHVHTVESNDAQDKLSVVLDEALLHYDLDWMALSNHLRPSERDHNGVDLVNGELPFSLALAQYEIPAVRELQAGGRYGDKLIFSTFEWDMPTHDHINVGIFTGSPLSTSLEAAKQFEYYFTKRKASQFDSADVARWDAAGTRAFTTHDDAVKAITWLRDNYPDTSYALINHPSRNNGKWAAADYRAFNDVAPNIVFAMEGMIGAQMEPDRGGYTTAYVDANRKNRAYGGVDYAVAQVGGVWDALLGDGRRFWNVGNSDHHFKIRVPHSSSYFPGEYARTYIWVDDKYTGVKGVLEGLRSGKMFSVYGDLINALDFHIGGGTTAADMGGELKAKAGETVSITIRFKSPDRNNYQYPIDSGISVNARPTVDHIDLIAGDVTPRAAPGTPNYSKDTNDSTRVIATFTAADWKLDKDGYNTMTYKYVATTNQYFRLRGTNLGMNVPGETENGNPLPDQKTDVTQNDARFNAINARNYNNLWFYSNPVFVTVGS